MQQSNPPSILFSITVYVLVELSDGRSIPRTIECNEQRSKTLNTNEIMELTTKGILADEYPSGLTPTGFRFINEEQYDTINAWEDEGPAHIADNDDVLNETKYAIDADNAAMVAYYIQTRTLIDFEDGSSTLSWLCVPIDQLALTDENLSSKGKQPRIKEIIIDEATKDAISEGAAVGKRTTGFRFITNEQHEAIHAQQYDTTFNLHEMRNSAISFTRTTDDVLAHNRHMVFTGE
jgi:hypothetical protein